MVGGKVAMCKERLDFSHLLSQESDLIQEKKEIKEKILNLSHFLESDREEYLNQKKLYTKKQKQQEKLLFLVNEKKSQLNREKESLNFLRDKLVFYEKDSQELIEKKAKKQEELLLIQNQIIQLEQAKAYELNQEEVTVSYDIYKDLAKVQLKKEHILETYFNNDINVLNSIDHNREQVSLESIKILKKSLESYYFMNKENLEQDFQEIQKRLNDLNRQDQDMKQSIQKHKNLKKTLEKKLNEEFEKEFHKLNEEFQRITKFLFQGQTTLISNKEEIFIEYTENNKVISLNNLSGGERSLMTLALFFALYSLKSSYLFFLDEVDAFLDDKNVYSFITLLKSYNRLQFILISHNKDLVKHIDYLIGVTMQKQETKTYEINIKEV